MEDTRVWRFRWRRKPGRPGPEGPKGEVEHRLFNSPDEVPDGQGWCESPAEAEQDAAAPRSLPKTAVVED